MKLSDICNQLGLVNLTPEIPLDKIEVQAGFTGDLLSDVLANAPRGGVLVTVQVHLNVLAVAVHADLAAVIFASGRKPEEAVRQKAIQENIPLLSTEKSALEISGRLWQLGVGGGHA